jgi:hypothetical protein
MNENRQKKKRIISRDNIQKAVTNNRLSSGVVTDEMINKLIRVLEENPEKSGEEIMTLILKSDNSTSVDPIKKLLDIS